MVIDILVQPNRDRWAALRFFRKLLHVAARSPRVIITDKLRSYAAARKLTMPEIKHRQSRYLNKRAENSHQPTRVRERASNDRNRHNVFSLRSKLSTLLFDCGGIFSLQLAIGY